MRYGGAKQGRPQRHPEVRRSICKRRAGRRRRTARHHPHPPADLLAPRPGRLHAALGGRKSWLVAGRILRPVHRLTAAARTAGEQNLSQRIALQGPRDELRELADTFDAMLDRLDRAFTSQRQFIANASHELRTPLTVMRTAIDVVLAKPNPTPAELLSMSVEVRQAVDHAQLLIEALLMLARNEKERALADSLDLATVVEDVLDGRSTDGITTTTALDEAPVSGDALLLERLVSNLLDNAERYNVASGTVSVSTTTNNGESRGALVHVPHAPVVVCSWVITARRPSFATAMAAMACGQPA
jgi:signal transduction histidine kinase